KAAGRTNGRYDTYAAAKAAQDACFAAASGLERLRFGPPLPTKAQADLNKALTCFSQAYTAHGGTMATAAKLMDGEPKPSQISAFETSGADAQAQAKDCALMYAAALETHDLSDFAAAGLKAAQRRNSRCAAGQAASSAARSARVRPRWRKVAPSAGA